MAENMTLKPRQGIILREEGDGAFLFDPVTGSLKYVNQTGIDVWNLLDGKTSSKNAAARIAELYSNADIEAVEADVSLFLAELAEAGFASD